MKKFLLLALMLFSVSNVVFAQDVFTKGDNSLKPSVIKSNSKDAEKIIKQLNKEVEKQIEQGYGPFLAVIYDKNGKLVAKMPNSVVNSKCSLNHAEMNTIREAHKNLNSYDLAPYDLSIYINAEPCIMCMGGIMWSGIKHVYYSVSSKDVEIITGFDEGYKPDWIEEFKKRGIDVHGDIDSEHGKAVLRKYVAAGKTIYKPTRD